MDAWTMDLERLRECSMTVKTADLRTIPFCAYHLTNVKG
jgi:7,8-dihydro-6-hydroxymethylpterin dimethyltransferase